MRLVIDTHRRSVEIAPLSNEAAERYKAGERAADIAIALGVSKVWVYEQIKAAGIPADWKRKGVVLKSVEDERIRAEKRAERAARDRLAAMLYKDGLGIRKIASKLDMSKKWVSMALRRQNVKMRRMPKQFIKSK